MKLVIPSSRGVMLSSTGDRNIDDAMFAAVLDCYNRFELTPAFFYINGDADYDHNAFAAKRAEGPYQGLAGVVGFGLPYLREKQSIDSNGYTIMYIVAHELGHITQFNTHGSSGRPIIEDLALPGGRVKFIELHADFVSGCYMADRYLRDTTREASVLNKSIVGDDDVTSIYHHGTSYERRTAFRLGYESRLSYRHVNHTIIDSLAIAGIEIIRREFQP